VTESHCAHGLLIFGSMVAGAVVGSGTLVAVLWRWLRQFEFTP
jgi:hypothetical protein